MIFRANGRIDVVIPAPSARAIMSPRGYFDPERPLANPEDIEREARNRPAAVLHECPVCHVVAASEEAFWLHAEPCLRKWWGVVGRRIYKGADVG